MNPVKVLFITTSHDKLGDTNYKTGVWLEELAAPYYAFKDAGADIMLTSPKGGRVPVDPKSQSIIVATSYTRRFLKDPEAMNFLAHSMLLDEINADDFDMVFIAGGHGSMWDIADNKTVKQLLEAFNNKSKLIGAVCHGVASLLSLQNEKGELLIKDKQLTGFSNSEEESAGLTSVVPFLLETRLISLGALYSKGADYITHVIDDGNIITGQNPASSDNLAKRIIALYKLNIHKTIFRIQPSLS
ncbi:MAG: type 1 glutamine amidotransferase domain-containing protein [Bacteroidota bacterium]